MYCHAVETGVVESLATQKSKRRTGMSSRASECVHCENRPTAAVNARSGVAKYFAESRGEIPDHRVPVTDSARTPASSIHLGDARHRSSKYTALDVGACCNAKSWSSACVD